MTFTKLVAAALLATASAGALAIGTAPAMAQPADSEAKADAMLKAAYAADGPGAAVIVTRKGRVIYAGGHGLADLEARRPITPDTAFKMGSIVKQFTAATVLQLVAEKKISLDDPVSRFFPDFPQPGARATVRQLLNHTSGIQDYSKIPGFMLSEPTLRPNSTADLLAIIRSRPSPFEPGKRWEYNNAGYVVLGAIVEKVTGKAWHEAVTERIARPLGLQSIVYAGANEGDPSRARGYAEDEGQFRPARAVHISIAHASGGLVGSVSDMAKWAQALHNGRVVNPELYREMTQPAKLADGSTQPYGFGLRLQQLRGRPMYVHGGAGRGVDTDSLYIPSEGLFVAVFANSDDLETDPSLLTRRLAAMALGDPFPTFKPAEVASSAIEPLFGAYRGGADGPDVRFFGRDGKFYLARGDNEMEAIPAGGDRFFFGPDKLIWTSFVRKPDGAHLLEVHEPESAKPESFVRAGAAPPPLAVAPEILRSYVGTYQTETVAVTVALAENGGLTIAPEGRGPLPMRPVSNTEFRVDAGGFRIVFHPENGKVDRFTMYRGARELHGKRTGG